MTAPRRLSQEGGFEGKLLRAGKAEQPRRDGVKRAAVAASTVALATCGGGAVKAGAGAGKLGSWFVITGGALLVALGVGVGVQASLRDAAPNGAPQQTGGPESPVAAAATVDPATTTTAMVPAVVSAPAPASPAASGAGSSAGRAAPSLAPAGPAPATPSGADELTRLRQAKTQLAARDAAAALETLDQYARAFPRGTLAEEAEALRVEALVGSGATLAARRAAETFLDRHPASPYAQRVRSVVGFVPAR